MRCAIGAALFIVLALPAAAQQPAPITEETLDKGLVNLGLMAGHAFQCTPEPQRADFQRMLLNFNAILLAQMGGNAAFRWAAAFGAGSSHDVDVSYCVRSLADWRKHVQDNYLDH
jgi:hypothetical protein